MCKENTIEYNQKKITGLWNGIINMLPTQPRSFDTNDDPGFWTNGEEILCPSEAEMNSEQASRNMLNAALVGITQGKANLASELLDYL